MVRRLIFTLVLLISFSGCTKYIKLQVPKVPNPSYEYIRGITQINKSKLPSDSIAFKNEVEKLLRTHDEWAGIINLKDLDLMETTCIKWIRAKEEEDKLIDSANNK